MSICCHDINIYTRARFTLCVMSAASESFYDMIYYFFFFISFSYIWYTRYFSFYMRQDIFDALWYIKIKKRDALFCFCLYIIIRWYFHIRHAMPFSLLLYAKIFLMIYKDIHITHTHDDDMLRYLCAAAACAICCLLPFFAAMLFHFLLFQDYYARTLHARALLFPLFPRWYDDTRAFFSSAVYLFSTDEAYDSFLNPCLIDIWWYFHAAMVLRLMRYFLLFMMMMLAHWVCRCRAAHFSYYIICRRWYAAFSRHCRRAAVFIYPFFSWYLRCAIFSRRCRRLYEHITYMVFMILYIWYTYASSSLYIISRCLSSSKRRRFLFLQEAEDDIAMLRRKIYAERGAFFLFMLVTLLHYYYYTLMICYYYYYIYIRESIYYYYYYKRDIYIDERLCACCYFSRAAAMMMRWYIIIIFFFHLRYILYIWAEYIWWYYLHICASFLLWYLHIIIIIMILPFSYDICWRWHYIRFYILLYMIYITYIFHYKMILWWHTYILYTYIIEARRRAIHYIHAIMPYIHVAERYDILRDVQPPKMIYEEQRWYCCRRLRAAAKDIYIYMIFYVYYYYFLPPPPLLRRFACFSFSLCHYYYDFMMTYDILWYYFHFDIIWYAFIIMPLPRRFSRYARHILLFSLPLLAFSYRHTRYYYWYDAYAARYMICCALKSICHYYFPRAMTYDWYIIIFIHTPFLHFRLSRYLLLWYAKILLYFYYDKIKKDYYFYLRAMRYYYAI